MLKEQGMFRRLELKLSSYMQISETPGIKRYSALIIGHSGDSWIWIIGLSLIWLFGKDSLNATACTMIISIFITTVVTFIIKSVVQRERPAGKRGYLYRKTDPFSFPSGHAARGAAITTVSLWICPLWITLLLAVWTSLLCLTRVVLKIHYVSDMLAGIGVGAAVALLVLQLY